MRIVVVHAHPSSTSFSHALFDTVVRALERHDVTAIDLYADDFQPAMSNEERHAYHSDRPLVHPLTTRYAEAVDTADALVFVYPTWWSGLPAMMKGWLEKVMVPGIAFGFADDGKVEPRLQHIRRIAGVTTYGSSRVKVALAADGGRRIVKRALRVSTGLRTRTTWLGLYDMDRASDAQRAAFLAKVEREFRSW